PLPSQAHAPAAPERANRAEATPRQPANGASHDVRADQPRADREAASTAQDTVTPLGDGALAGLAGRPPEHGSSPDGGAFGDDGLDERTRVEGRLKKGVEEFMVQQDTKSGARGTVSSLRRALRDRFEPTASYVQSIPGSEKANAQIAKNR